MSKKEKNKSSRVDELKAGDEIGVEIDGKEQAITLDAEQAEALNEQMKEGGVAEESKEESVAPKEEKVLNGTPRFNKFNQ